MAPRAPVEAWTAVRAVGPQWELDDNTLTWTRLGTYFLWDASVGWRPDEALLLRLRATNLLDHTITTAIGFPEPGRRVWVEVEFRPPPAAEVLQDARATESP